ncbi:unnamed protein product [Rotaria magnacalcarata]|uniref:Uncharacterized protein n=1 Tax=Rotaria magnacalcarata TaxID=392030 RepID=A0A816SPN1_9BILA|nr:unnamed protein product [Rotaria magnacalcarata]CAF1642985.1 unnamed protein product [Rotaria magnacalcarata]CAF2034860.1 unnamed protein product [Rotaria magnacalcarata]CAF2051191.1 unnamed protein product [Rotaria magnacalcarata]CAF2087566.1 unnamed protein product [Rotaria magnacalcarata]
MIKETLICTTAGLMLLTITFIIHIIAMAHPRWKIYEHRRESSKTIFIGTHQRCESYNRTITTNLSGTSLICYDNKYCFQDNHNCANASFSLPCNERQKICNYNQNKCACDYSPIGKGLISCTIISAIALGLSLLLIFLQMLINEFKHKIHIYVAIITLCLLFLGFIFILITLILLGSTMSYDLHQYVYNLDLCTRADALTCCNRTRILKEAAEDYEIRLDWSSVLEIIALILSSFTIVTQAIYLFFTHRNRIG